MTGASGFRWHEGDSFAELIEQGDGWEIAYGFEATASRGRVVVARHSAVAYDDAVRQLWQVIGYYFAEPEHAEQVRRTLLEQAGIAPGDSKYRPVPNSAALTTAGGGIGAREEVAAEDARRERILRGEPEPAPEPAPTVAERRPWWRRFGR